MTSLTTVPLTEYDILEIDDDQKYKLAEGYRDSGKLRFGANDIEGAFRQFADGIKSLILINSKTTSEEINQRKNELLPVLQNNAAACHLHQGNWEYAIHLLTSVLNQEPENVKALYRRGTAYMEIQEYEKSALDLYAAQALDPDNTAIKLKLDMLNTRLRKFNKEVGESMKKMFR